MLFAFGSQWFIYISLVYSINILHFKKIFFVQKFVFVPSFYFSFESLRLKVFQSKSWLLESNAKVYTLICG